MPDIRPSIHLVCYISGLTSTAKDYTILSCALGVRPKAAEPRDSREQFQFYCGLRLPRLDIRIATATH